MRAGPGGRDHGAVEPPARREDAGRVDEDELRVAFDGDAAHDRPRRLHLRAHDRDLGADQRVDEGRFADVRRADDGDEPAAPIPGRSDRRGGLPVLAHGASTPSRDNSAAAAACSAARLERPRPSAGIELRQLHRDAELRVVVRAGAGDLAIGRCRQAARLGPFLQRRLRIAHRGRGRAQAIAPQLLDRGGRSLIAAVEEHRADQGFADVGEDRRAVAAAGIGLRGPELDGGAEIDRARDVGAGLLAHEIGEPARQLAFVRRREAAKQQIGDHEPEHVIAEKLETLVASDPVLAAQRRDVGQCAVEERGVRKGMADLLFEFTSARCRPAAHLTIVNSRFQRTAHGQVQICHAGSPSPIEKKMICARPTRFSNGT